MQRRSRRARMMLVKMLLFVAIPGAARGLLSTSRSGSFLLARRAGTNRFSYSTDLSSTRALVSSRTESRTQTLLDTDTDTNTDADSSSTRKRLGKSSFLYKQQQQQQQQISNPGSEVTSADDLRKLAQSHSGKSVGSSMYKKAWTRWLYLAVESIRNDLGKQLLNESSNIDANNTTTRTGTENEESIREAFEKLFFDLGVAADVGTMPSFESSAARIGYSLEFFCRARALAEFFLETPPMEQPISNARSTTSIDNKNINNEIEPVYPEFWTMALRSSDCPLLAASTFETSNKSYEIVSLGGGPGFDFVGVAMAAAFSFHTTTTQTGAGAGDVTTAPRPPPTKIHVTAMDYEEGWKDLVSAMDQSTRNILTPTTAAMNGESTPSSQLPSMSCDWGGKCDITKSILNDPVNAHCKKLLLGGGQEQETGDPATARFWICQYCVAENAKALRASNYVFLKELVQGMHPGSMVLLTEVVPRLWPEMVRMLEHEGLLALVNVGFRKGYCGKQFLLQKRSVPRTSENASGDKDGPFASLDARTRDQLEHFEKLASYHERKVDSGWKRQGRKANGSEYHQKHQQRLRQKRKQAKSAV